MRLLASIIGALFDYGFTARSRVRCIRRGHSLLCTVDGHLCTRCGPPILPLLRLDPPGGAMPPKTTSRFEKIATELVVTARQATQCRLCLFLADAPDVDAEYISGLLADPSRSASHVTLVLNGGGVDITPSSVKRHRQLHLGRA